VSVFVILDIINHENHLENEKMQTMMQKYTKKMQKS